MAKKRTVSPYYTKQHQRLVAKARDLADVRLALDIQLIVKEDLRNRRAAGGAK